jgi:hypothetical protein
MQQGDFRMKRILIVVLFLALCGCARKQPASQSANADPGKVPEQPRSEQPKRGEATGTFTVDGQTFTVKYAYADRLPRSHKENVKDINVLVTDKPIPEAALADEMQNSTKLSAGEIRGVRYIIFAAEGGFAFQIYPSAVSSSVTENLKEFAVEGDSVKGRDEDSLTFFEKTYSRSLSFVAPLPKEKQ